MAKNSVRDALLAEAKARHRAAGQKVSRLEHQGVRVRKAELDPRQSMGAVREMSSRQLRSYINRLNSFTSRSNSYVAGRRGEPLSGQTWRQYQRLEKRYNAQVGRFTEGILGFRDPVINETLGERLGDRSSRVRAGDYRTFNPITRNAENITSQDALKKLMKSMAKRVDPQYLEKEARLQRRIINKMLARTGNKELLADIRGMSDEDVITLAQYTDFMPTLEGSYAMAKSTSTDRPRWQSAVYEDNQEKVHDWVDWAKTGFGRNTDSEQDSDDTRTTTTSRTGSTKRDRYGRFIGKQSLPEPDFARDDRGRFTKRK